MKARYVSNSRARVRIFTNDVTILTHLHRRLVAEGFQQVSFIKFWVHVATAGKRGFVVPESTPEVESYDNLDI